MLALADRCRGFVAVHNRHLHAAVGGVVDYDQRRECVKANRAQPVSVNATGLQFRRQP